MPARVVLGVGAGISAYKAGELLRLLTEAGHRVTRLEQELAALQEARASASDHSKTAQASVAAALSSAAERIEDITKKLNQTIGSSVALG